MRWMLDPGAAARRSPLTFRAVILGLVGTIVICGLTPYNDYALNNTFLVGNNLPIGLVLLLFLFVVFINGPLNRFAPAYAFSTAEMVVAFSMALVSCALPSSGLMRYLPASLTGPSYFGRENPEFQNIFENLQLPRWLFPSFASDSPRQWTSDPIVEGFHNRWTSDGPIPYLAWLTPALTWGVLIFALYGAMLCMISILRLQWFENERLQFPLAQIQLALLEQPPAGRMFNRTFTCRSFWIALGAIFLLHIYNGLGSYFPRHITAIPVQYNIEAVMSETPWVYADIKLKNAVVFFTALGVAYFLPGSVSFSLWFFFILANVRQLLLGTFTGDQVNHGRLDEHTGGVIAYALLIAWIGRRHWRLVIAQAFRGARAGEPQEQYLSYRRAFWGFIGCVLVMIAWMISAGATPFGAIVTITLFLVLFLVITRIIAETGLVHGQIQFSLLKPWYVSVLGGWHRPVPLETYYVASLINSTHYDYREVVPVYASHGLKLFDDAQSRSDRRTGAKFIAMLGLALLVGYAVSFSSMLWTEYTHAVTRDVSARYPINDFGAMENPRNQVIDTIVTYSNEHYFPQHNVAAHMTGGFGFTMVLAFLRYRFSWWPLHPVGYLMLLTLPGGHFWFSIMLGWLCRSLILRFGGADLYTNAKPFFLGLIVGESLAAGAWLVTGIVLSALGVPYRPVQIMPA